MASTGNYEDVSDTEIYDDTALRAPMRALTLGAHTIDRGSNVSGTHSGQLRQTSTTSSSGPHLVDPQLVQMQVALRISQLEVEEQKSRNAALCEQLVDANGHRRVSRPVVVVASNTAEPESASSNSDGPQDDDLPHQKKAWELGKIFSLLYRPWICKSLVLRIDAHRPNISVRDYYERYNHNEDSESRAIIAEVWDFLEAAQKGLCDDFGADLVAVKRFVGGINYEKSKFVYACTQNIEAIFEDLGLSGALLRSPDARRSCEQLRAIGPADAEDIFAKVLFPSENTDDPRYLFHTKKIVMVLRSGLFGLKAVYGTTRPAANCKASKWGVKAVTPGMIALAATVLIYLTSGDTLFAPLSMTSKTTWDYPWLFETYYRKIVEGLHKGWPGLVTTYQWINTEVFGNLVSGTSMMAHTQPSSTQSDRYKRMNALFATPLEAVDRIPTTATGLFPTVVTGISSRAPSRSPSPVPTEPVSPLSRSPSPATTLLISDAIRSALVETLANSSLSTADDSTLAAQDAQPKSQPLSKHGSKAPLSEAAACDAPAKAPELRHITRRSARMTLNSTK